MSSTGHAVCPASQAHRRSSNQFDEGSSGGIAQLKRSNRFTSALQERSLIRSALCRFAQGDSVLLSVQTAAAVQAGDRFEGTVLEVLRDRIKVACPPDTVDVLLGRVKGASIRLDKASSDISAQRQISAVQGLDSCLDEESAPEVRRRGHTRKV